MVQQCCFEVALGYLAVSVLASGTKIRGFKPGRGRWILRTVKSAARLPSGESKAIGRM
jgi:hypothetical protein